MRDPKAYEAHGRNNPLAPEQRREHPYDFVSLPDKPARGQAVGHHRYAADRLTGTLRLVYVTSTPLHVGSGVFETASECGLGSGDTPVRGIMRRQGKPILPGSGWKGAVRARFEAITRSRLGLVDMSSREPAFKVPDALKSSGGSHRVEIQDQRVRSDLRPPGTIWRETDLAGLSPAEALFGCMGYRGRLHPNDGVITGPAATEPLDVAPLEGPAMHRLAKPGKARNEHGTIQIAEVEGRKFYYDGPIVHSRQDERTGGGRYELIDYVPAGSTIALDIHLESLTLAELGALLISAGHGAGGGVVRFGGYKPVGLGKVELREAGVSLDRGSSTRSWRREAKQTLDLATAVAEAKKELVDVGALTELETVTTRQRPE